MPGQPQRDSGSRVLEPVVADAVAAAGFDLEALEVTMAGRRRLVKVVVDADDGVDLDDVAEVSRAVSATLDAHDAVLGGPYTLEVTSPGLDRPLTRPRHWRRARFRLANVKLVDGTSLTGRVGRCDDEPDGTVIMLVDGELRQVAYTDVAHAVVEVEFKQPPVDELKLLEERESR